MRLAWCTDIHLDHLSARARERFAQALAGTGADAILVTGDISDASRLRSHLAELAGASERAVHFVLGNHDFYGGSIERVRAEVRALCDEDSRLHWLPACEPLWLDEETALVGCDGFGDARLGDGLGTPVVLNDHLLIRELAGLPRPALVRRLSELGDAEAKLLEARLVAVSSARRVVVATHVPPFREAAWHEGKPSNEQWLPFFSCKAVGDVLAAHARAHPDTVYTVLCGHTHGAGVARLARNLVVHTGPADYGAPAIAGVLDTALPALLAGEPGA